MLLALALRVMVFKSRVVTYLLRSTPLRKLSVSAAEVRGE
jgi:hypothetical protein